MDYSNLNSKELALILATEIVKKEIDNNWDFSDDSPGQIATYIAKRFYEFLEND